MDMLFERGWIHNPKGKAKSVRVTEEGVASNLPLHHYTRYANAPSCPRGGNVLDFVPNRGHAVVGEIRDCTGSSLRRQAATCPRQSAWK